MHILYFALDKDPTPEDFSSLVLTPELISSDLLGHREPCPLPPVIASSLSSQCFAIIRFSYFLLGKIYGQYQFELLCT